MNNLPNLYLVGKGGAGKTKIAEYLIQNYGYKQAKVAYPVYSIAINYLGMSPEPSEKNRPLLQHVGSNVGRNKISQDIWINRYVEDIWIAQETARDLYDKEIRFISDDVRFENEHLSLRDAGWVGIYLDAPKDLRITRLIARDGDAQEECLNHISETELDEFKDELIKVDTSGSLEQSFENLEQTLEHIRKETNNVK